MQICSDIPEIVLTNLLRHNILDENFNYESCIQQITESEEYKEFYAAKMKQKYTMEEELVPMEFNTLENISKHIYKKSGKRSKKKKSKRKKSYV